MKKIISVFTTLFLYNFLFAQTGEVNTEVQVIKCSDFFVTPPLKTWADVQEIIPRKIKISTDRDNRPAPVKLNYNSLPDGNDPAMQSDQGTRNSAGIISNFNGEADNFSIPPDPSGAAGPNHYVQATNVYFRIFNKTGTALTSKKSLSSLWPKTRNDGDPIVLYDKYADRWLISQFQDSTDFTGGQTYALVAISTSPDPTGKYYAFKFKTSQLPDYLKFSIWSDGYYMGSNQWPLNMVVLERSKMLLGDSTARMIVKSFSPQPPRNGFFYTLPADADGQLPPSGTPCYIFSYEDDGWSSSNTDAIRVYKMTTDWTTPSNTKLEYNVQLPTASFDASSDGNWEDISQPGTTDKLDVVGGILYFRAQFRKWVGYNSVVLCHAVKVKTSPKQYGLRWYELRQDAVTGIWNIYQQSTFSPDGLNRWMGSIAMDDNGSIALAYAVSGVDGTNIIYPSIRYTGRWASDPLNQMTFAETTAATGLGYFAYNRFGDYSQTSLDPDGITFWHTGEYIGSGSSQKTKIFSFQLPTPISINEKEIQAAFLVFQTGYFLNIKAKELPDNNELVVDLFDVDGKYITGKKIVPASNSMETNFNIVHLPKAAYLVRVGNINFQKVVKVILN